MKLFMVLLGCRPEGRNTEQHDVFFGIGRDLKSLIPQMNAFWPDSGGLHIDAWREINTVDGHSVNITARAAASSSSSSEARLYFINLGGYRENEFEEFHFKLLSVGSNVAEAVKRAKLTSFFAGHGIKQPGGVAHIDDKSGFDVDDVIKIDEALHPSLVERFVVELAPAPDAKADRLHIGYLPISKIK